MEKGRRKRRRDAKEEEEEEDTKVVVGHDTLMALRMMCGQFYSYNTKQNPTPSFPFPFVLRTQLYSSLNDRTQVDRDLESLKIQKVIRIFKLNTGQDDHAVMFLDDYLAQIDTIANGLSTPNQVFHYFKTFVLDSTLDVSIHHNDLCSALSCGEGEGKGPEGNVKVKVLEHHVSLLIHAGLLTRQLTHSDIYWFAIPNIGSVLKGLSQGRKELLSLLRRKNFKEMLLATLEKKRLRLSPFDVRFHIRDLIGSGHLKTHQTPIGLVVRVSGD